MKPKQAFPRGRRLSWLVACVVGVAAPLVGSDLADTPAPLGRIAFERYFRASDATRSTSTLYVLDLVTGETRRVGEKRYPDAYARLTWTPDGSAITFVANVERTTWRGQIYRVGVDGRGLSQLYPSGSNDSYPAWSRDWRLAYGHTPSEGIGGPIYVNGSVYFDAEAALSRPAWSPDGSVLLVPHMDGAVYSVRAAGRVADRFLQPEPGVQFSSPVYSPDGSKVAFEKKGGVIAQGQAEIWVVNADASLPTMLTSGSSDHYPTWSPDGFHIAFQRNTLSPYGTRIMLMDADGSNARTLIEDAGYPAWAP